jgi:hypothetical protein
MAAALLRPDPVLPVSAAELLEMRDAFPHGKYNVAIEPLTFSMRAYRAFLASIAPEARTAEAAPAGGLRGGA